MYRMSSCKFLEQPSLLGRNGDMRVFKKGEPVCLKDDFFNEGIYEGTVLQPGTGKAFIHLITSTNATSGRVYRKRHVSARNVGKKIFPVSPTAMKKILEEKVGDPYFSKIMSQQGYGTKRKTRKYHKKSRKTRKTRRV